MLKSVWRRGAQRAGCYPHPGQRLPGFLKNHAQIELFRQRALPKRLRIAPNHPAVRWPPHNAAYVHV